MVRHRESTKRRAIDVAVFVLGLQIEKMKIEAGEATYREPLPHDANWWERFGNEGALRKGSIYRQAAKKFGYKDMKQIQRLCRLARERWNCEVVAEYERDLAVDIDAAARNRRRKARDELMMALLSSGGWRTFSR